jgi:hypothetical protein
MKTENRSKLIAPPSHFFTLEKIVLERQNPALPSHSALNSRVL